MLDFLKKTVQDTISVNELDPLIGTIELIDVREPQEVAMGTIKTAKNIPMAQLLANPAKYLMKTKKYYIMCQSGMRSSRTVRQLQKNGFDVVNVKGGFGSYTGAKRKK